MKGTNTWFNELLDLFRHSLIPELRLRLRSEKFLRTTIEEIPYVGKPLAVIVFDDPLDQQAGVEVSRQYELHAAEIAANLQTLFESQRSRDMIDDIKVVILGNSQSGKTCFMTGMYGSMQRQPEGFSLTMSDDSDVMVNELWREIFRPDPDSEVGRWPQATQESKNYRFHFGYGLDPLIEFDWLDYRGVALNESSSDGRKLMAHIQDSCCIFLCVSGEHFTTSMRGRILDVAYDVDSNRMIQLLTSLGQKIGGRKPPIVILVTKCDLYQTRQDKHEVTKEIQELFKPLFVEDSDWLVAICPVSLGMELAENPDGRVDPQDMDRAIAFSIYAFLKEEAELEREVEHLGRNFFVRLWNHRAIKEKQKVMIAKGIDPEEIERKMKVLVNGLLNGMEVYHRGERRSFDV